jgi:hypothetical protein
MALSAVNRLRYHFKSPEEEAPEECEKTFWIRQCLDQGINNTGCVNFNVPPDHMAFTDCNSMYLRICFRVLRADGTAIDNTDAVFLGPGSLQSLAHAYTKSVTYNGPDEFVRRVYKYPESSSVAKGAAEAEELVRLPATFHDLLYGPRSALKAEEVRYIRLPTAGAFFDAPIDVIYDSCAVAFLDGNVNCLLVKLDQILMPGLKVLMDDSELSRCAVEKLLKLDVEAFSGLECDVNPGQGLEASPPRLRRQQAFCIDSDATAEPFHYLPGSQPLHFPIDLYK